MAEQPQDHTSDKESEKRIGGKRPLLKIVIGVIAVLGAVFVSAFARAMKQIDKEFWEKRGGSGK